MERVRVRLAPRALLLLALPGALLVLLALVNTLLDPQGRTAEAWRSLWLYSALWLGGVVAYAACWLTLRRRTAWPWLAGVLLLGLGAFPLMLSGIGILAFAAALALAVGARFRPGFSAAYPGALVVGVAAAAVFIGGVGVALREGMALALEVALLAILGGIALALLWPPKRDGRAARPSPTGSALSRHR